MSPATGPGPPVVLIVSGHLIVDAAERSSYLEGCRGSGPSDEQQVAVLRAPVAEYEVAGWRSLTG